MEQEKRISKSFFDYIKNLVRPEIFKKIQKYSEPKEQIINGKFGKLKICKVGLQYTDEMLEFFKKRTSEHINRVKENMISLDGFRGFTKKELKERGDIHDLSKYGKEEHDPYVWLTEFHKKKNDGFKYPAGIEAKVKIATGHHIKSNPHHPEAHSNINEMSDMDIIEMICDWTAMSQELKEKNESAKVWADKKVGVKWKFNKERTEFIYSIISELDKINNVATKDDSLKNDPIENNSLENNFNKVFKINDDKQIALCIVIEPMTKVTPTGDTQGDSMTADEIEKTAHSFAMNGMKIDFRHNGKELKDIFIIESGIHRGPDFKIGEKSQIIKTGTWYVGIYAKDDKIWKALKSGKLGGVSPGGFGKRRALN